MVEFSRDLQEGLEGHYRVRLAWRYETVEFLGLPYLGDERPLTLPEIYVPLSLTRTYGGDKRLYVPEALEQSHHLVVLGDPGSGKSTLVKLLAYSFGRIEPTPLARRLGPRLPVPIILRDYKVRQWQSPEDMLRDFIAQLDEDIRSEVTVEWLLTALIEGRGILLMDGLDEVGSQDERQHLRDQVVFPLLQRMPESLVVLTSRIVGYEDVPFDTPVAELGGLTVSPFGPQHCYVAPFNDEEIDQFITKWYTVRERDARERQRRLVSLREALRRSDRIHRLAANPSLLTLMALIHRVTAELPSGRVKLYDKITEAYLETIQRYRGLTPYEASLEQMKRWLAVVGWEMQSRRTKSQDGDLLLSREEVLRWLTQAIKADRPNAREESERFLEYIAQRSGLLVPRGPEQFAFAHLTFQEYFAAWHMRGLLRRFDTLAAMCAERVADERWHETLLLLFELLAEFPGAGDELADELQQRTHDEKTRRGTIALFAELLLDDQSGLSLRQQEHIAHIALAAACSDSNYIVDLMRKLSPERFDTLVRPWLDQQLAQASPETMGQVFFLIAYQFDAYRLDWPEKLGTWVAKRGTLAWSVRQIRDAVAIGGSNLEVSAWAGSRLSFMEWLYDEKHKLSLADLRMLELLQLQDRSPKHRLLAQLSAMYAVSRSHLLPYLYFISMDQGKAEGLLQVLTRSLTRAGTGTGPLGIWAWTWVQTRYAAQVRTVAWTRVQAVAWRRVFAEAGAGGRVRIVEVPFRVNTTPAPPPEWPVPLRGLTTEAAWAEWLFFSLSPTPDALQTHIGSLEKLAAAPDHWTRLLGLTSLMLLGEGTSQRCAERNTLLDHGMLRPESFTFPGDVQEVTATEEFARELPILLQQTFLHKPGEPWLQPEWFDPSHPAARFFRARPREFFARAAEVLDPEGKTDLAKWRQSE